jgi:hypothetical protein
MLAWPTGKPLPTKSNALSQSSVATAGGIGLAAGLSNYFAVWDEAYAKGGDWSLVGQIITPAATRTTPTNLKLSAGRSTQRYPTLRFDGTAYRLMTQRLVSNAQQVFMTSFDARGAVVKPAKQLTAVGRHYPGGLACKSGTCLVAWSTRPILSALAEATRLDANNTQLDSPPRLLATPSDDQRLLRLVNDGSQLLYIWLQRQGRAGFQAFIRRQDLGGNWLDAAPVRLLINGKPVDGSFHPAALPGGGFALIVTTPIQGTSSSTRHFVTISRAGQVSSAVISKYDQDSIGDLICGPSECLLTAWDHEKYYAYRLDHKGSLFTPQPVVLSCGVGLHVMGNGYWCIAPTESGPKGQTITRLDRTLAIVGSPLHLPVVADDIGGPVLHKDATGVTLIFSAADTSAGKLMAARVNLAGDKILTAPKELLRSSFDGAFAPQAILPFGQKTYFAWQQTDGSWLYRIRMRELDATLTLVGPTTEFAPKEPGYRSVQVVAVDNDDMVLAYIERDSHPDRGSHRIKIRHTAKTHSVDAGVPPLDLGGYDMSQDTLAVADVATADASTAADAGHDLATADAAKADLADASGPTDMLSADAGIPAGDLSVRPDAGQPVSPGGCTCEAASHPSYSGFWTLFPFVLAVVMRRRCRQAWRGCAGGVSQRD